MTRPKNDIPHHPDASAEDRLRHRLKAESRRYGYDSHTYFIRRRAAGAAAVAAATNVSWGHAYTGEVVDRTRMTLWGRHKFDESFSILKKFLEEPDLDRITEGGLPGLEYPEAALVLGMAARNRALELDLPSFAIQELDRTMPELAREAMRTTPSET